MLRKTMPLKRNITGKAINDLKENETIVIIKGDKGDATIVM